MGPGVAATQTDLDRAYELGSLIAGHGWVLLTGGRSAGVMHAASKGAREANGLVLGILPGNNHSDLSEYVDVAIVTGMGSARNNINVLSSDVVIALGTGAGTASEIALAIKADKTVLLLSDNQEGKAFFKQLSADKVHIVTSPGQAIETIGDILACKGTTR